MNQYVDPFLAFVKSLPLDFNQQPPENSYSNAVLIAIDAVLSMNRKYEGFVVPRIKFFEKSGITSFSQLIDVINKGGTEGFAKIWNYNDPKRVEILQHLAQKFLQLKEEYGLTDDLETLHKWGREAKPEEWKSFGVSGIAFTTYQYLRILCGANTVKPDIYIQRAFIEATGKKRPLEEMVTVVEEVAKKMNIQANQLDYALWSYFSNRL